MKEKNFKEKFIQQYEEELKDLLRNKKFSDYYGTFCGGLVVLGGFAALNPFTTIFGAFLMG